MEVNGSPVGGLDPEQVIQTLVGHRRATDPERRPDGAGLRLWFLCCR